jgi:hypothetical protein
MHGGRKRSVETQQRSVQAIQNVDNTSLFAAVRDIDIAPPALRLFFASHLTTLVI